jgi:hypothetical protein
VITFLFALSLACGVPEPSLADHEIRQALDGNLPMDRQARVETFGSHRVEWFPVEPSTDGTTSYRVWVDPMYDHDCFEQRVVETLSDDRSWPNLRLADENEAPQFWVTLVAPGAACGSAKMMMASCAFTTDRIIRMNALRWVRGYGHYSLEEEQSMVLNHEVGHILGFGHSDCSLMGTPKWVSGAGWPKWDTEWDNCDPSVWPSETERAEAWSTYASGASQ